MHLLKLKYVFQLLLLLQLVMVSLANANSFESLMMPGPLIEGHAKFENNCSKCHSDFSKEEQTGLCADCHKEIKKDLKLKKGYHGRNILAIKQECKQCHTDHKGRKENIIVLDKETFNHKSTDFELKGQHLQVQCESCHKPEKKYREAESKCYSCHKKSDPHDGKLGKKCESCHNEKSWKKMSFDHDDTDFPLKGKHEKAQCQSCHPDNRHKNTPTKCFSCHALDDAHNTRYGKKCQTCHNSSDWKKAKFDHNKETKFKLKGSHTKVLCDSCHTGTANIYKKKPGKKCISCHKSDDIHKGKNGKKCQNCHTSKSWKNSKFSHSKDTDFPLKGKHSKLQCSACHQGSMHKNKLKKDCVSCHKVDDVHRGQQGKKCQDCHNEHGWSKEVKFNHDLTVFPLIGQHVITACEECHISNEYKDAKIECASCHEEDDKHKKTQGHNCHNCHNPNSWSLWLFNHDKQTRFMLDGSHKNLECSACHKTQSDDDIEKSSTCSTCHLRDDVHRGGFGKHCEQCHNTDKFSEINISR